MSNEISRESLEGQVKPRKPLILRTVPELYYTDNQLAAAIQSVEAALFSVCFRQYPQAFSTMYSGLEKLCKNSAGLDRLDNFRMSWEKAGECLELLDDPLFEKEIKQITNRKGATEKREVFRYQNEWTDLRNDIEHQGDSPSYDARAASLFLGSLWDAFELILLKSRNYDLKDALLPETRRALEFTKEVLRLTQGADFHDSLFFDEPLVCHMRKLVQPTFQDWSDDYERYFNSHTRFDGLVSWKRKIEQSRSELEWRSCDCPVCESRYSILGFMDEGDDDTLIVKFESFCCPECGISIRDHDVEPNLAQTVLYNALNELLPEIARDCGVAEAFIRW
jgi:hypothetical protein